MHLPFVGKWSEVVEAVRFAPNAPFLGSRFDSVKAMYELFPQPFVLFTNGAEHDRVRPEWSELIASWSNERITVTFDESSLHRSATEAISAALGTPIDSQTADAIVAFREAAAKTIANPLNFLGAGPSLQREKVRLEGIVGGDKILSLLVVFAAAIPEVIKYAVMLARKHEVSRSDADALIEETMRLYPPVPTIGKMGKNGWYYASLANATVDAAQFPEPYEFRLRRPGVEALNFISVSPRFCPGRALALHVIRKALDDILKW